MAGNLIDQIDPEIPPLPEKPTYMEKTQAFFKAGKMHERIRLFNDKAYYCVLVFANQDQVRAFVTSMGWLDDKSEIHFIDGRVVAAKEGIELPFVDEQLLHEAYSRRRVGTNWPEGLKFFDETKPLDTGETKVVGKDDELS